jgi:hypothetical protein
MYYIVLDLYCIILMLCCIVFWLVLCCPSLEPASRVTVVLRKTIIGQNEINEPRGHSQVGGRLVFLMYAVRIPAGTPVILTEAFRGFSHFFRANPEIEPPLRHDRFLPDPFRSVIIQPSYSSTVCSVDNWYFLKIIYRKGQFIRIKIIKLKPSFVTKPQRYSCSDSKALTAVVSSWAEKRCLVT